MCVREEECVLERMIIVMFIIITATIEFDSETRTSVYQMIVY